MCLWSYRVHVYLFLVSVGYCEVEVPATVWSLVHRNPTECDVSVFIKPEELEGLGPLRLFSHKKIFIIKFKMTKQDPFLWFVSYEVRWVKLRSVEYAPLPLRDIPVTGTDNTLSVAPAMVTFVINPGGKAILHTNVTSFYTFRTFVLIIYLQKPLI